MADRPLPTRDAPPRMTSYEDERASFRLAVPERFNAVLDIVERWAREAPDDLALVSLGPTGDLVREQSVADLAFESRRAARALLALGVGPGDPVFVMLPRVPEWYAVMLGAIRIGAVPMPAPNQLTPRDISYRLRTADAPGAAPPQRVGRGRAGLARLRRARRRGGRRRDAGGPHGPRGSDAALLHERDGEPPEDGHAAFELRARPRPVRPLLA